MNRYAKGRRYEYRTMEIFKCEGYYCIRSAGSHKKADVVAFLQKDGLECPAIRFIQVKSGNSPYKKELVSLEKLTLPYNVSKEMWLFKPRCKNPTIICIENNL